MVLQCLLMPEHMKSKESKAQTHTIADIIINLLVVYRESVNLIGYITRRLSADSQQL